MNSPIGLLGSPYACFVALVVIGVLVGTGFGRLNGARHWIATLSLIGVAGSWIGSEVAVILGLAARASGAYLMTGALGAVLVLWGWRRLHPIRAEA